MKFAVRGFKAASAPFLLTCLIATQSFAGAWTAEKGAMYHKLSTNHYSADEYFDNDGEKTDYAQNGNFRDFNAGYYLEYGLLDNLTLNGSISFKSLRFENDSVINKSTGFSDLELGAKYRILGTKGGALSVQGLVKIPDTYDENDAVPMGNGQYDTEMRFLFGQSLSPVLPAYVNVEAGYRFRAEDPADEIRFLLEFGMDFSSNCYGRVKLDGIYGMNNEDDEASLTGNPTATPNYDLGKLDMAVGYKMDKNAAIEFGCRPEMYGKNTSAGVNWSVSYVYMIGSDKK